MYEQFCIIYIYIDKYVVKSYKNICPYIIYIPTQFDTQKSTMECAHMAFIYNRFNIEPVFESI